MRKKHDDAICISRHRLLSVGAGDAAAKLFEAGEYPDKGLTVTEEHLRALCERFGGPVPVLIEHGESPLEIGELTEIEAMGTELFGTLALTPEANALVDRSGASALSVGLAPDLSAIREVSLVRNPRVPSARLFGDSVLLSGSLNDAGWKARFERLESEQRRETARRRVAGFLSEGKLCPAQAPFAEALLLASGSLTFNGAPSSVGELVEGLLSHQPPLALFGERAPGFNEAGDAALLLPEEADFYRRHFPEIELAAIAARR